MDEWSFACPDWEERLRDGRSLIPDLPLDKALARRAVGIFNKMRLPDVAGFPSLREAGGDWQRDIVAALFGSLDRNGRRRVRRLFNLIPKKNNKTTGSAAIMLTALLMDNEPRQKYSLLGATQAIADRGFDQAYGMIMADPVLKGRFLPKPHLKTIVDLVTDSTLKVQTFDEKVVTGDIPKGMLIDELHILGKVHYARRVWGQLWGGLVARPGGFLIEISTQSDEAPAGVFADELKLARRIRDGKVTGAAATMLPVLYELPERIQSAKERLWLNPDVWPLVLPNLGRSVHMDLLLEQFAEAVEKGREEENRWASQHLNVQIGMGLQDERWLGADYWEGAAWEPLRDLDTLLARSEVAVIGMDGGGLDDLTGVCVLGRDKVTKVWLYWCHAWAHRKVLEIRKDIAPRLIDFEEDGDLTFWGAIEGQADVASLLEGEAEAIERGIDDDDVIAIVNVCKRVRDSGLLPKEGAIGTDRAAIGALLDALREAGFTLSTAEAGAAVEAVSQSAANMNSAILTLQRKLEAGGAAHGGTRLMAWCVGNAKAVQRGNAVAIDKQVSGKAKIDPLIAAFVATKLMEADPVASNDSVDDWLSSLRGAA
ncbi:terminase large subunit domain-containing protein [Novosphingobium sp.]|uniref:terminase large subunit domain-containing protein n=1 Tax=Novosphingobium sp. TaxID=1874826 RepID=UPI0038B9EC08